MSSWTFNWSLIIVSRQSAYKKILEDGLTQENKDELTQLSASLHIFQSLIPMAEECLMDLVEASMALSAASGLITPILMILYKNL